MAQVVGETCLQTAKVLGESVCATSDELYYGVSMLSSITVDAEDIGNSNGDVEIMCVKLE
eukprot:scaffold4405_cov112-Skeletonema_dohrnii-CCMP3373.AAC.2